MKNLLTSFQVGFPTGINSRVPSSKFMDIKEFNIIKFPAVIFSDSHTNLSNIRRLKELYPDSQFFSLGDICQLFAKKGDKSNELSIQYFIDNKIPSLDSNHESHICGVEDGNHLLVLDKSHTIDSGYDLPKHQVEWLTSLPRGFKLILPNGKNYYCFHNQPLDLWTHPDKITEIEFREKYIFDDNTLAVICGHCHTNKIDEFTPKRILIGQLAGDDHHTKSQNGGNYLLLTEKGLEFKKL